MNLGVAFVKWLSTRFYVDTRSDIVNDFYGILLIILSSYVILQFAMLPSDAVRFATMTLLMTFIFLGVSILLLLGLLLMYMYELFLFLILLILTLFS